MDCTAVASWQSAGSPQYQNGVPKETSLNVIVKNTFLDVDETDEGDIGSCRRSSSVPRTWKPRLSCNSFSSTDGPPSFASATTSDGGLSDASDLEPGTPKRLPSGPRLDISLADRLPKEAWRAPSTARSMTGPLPAAEGLPATPNFKMLNPKAAEFRMPPPSPLGCEAFSSASTSASLPATPATNPENSPVSSSGSPTMTTPNGTVARLNPEARTFEPGATSFTPLAMPVEISNVVSSFQSSLTSHKNVKGVQVALGAMGSMTTVSLDLGEDAAVYGTETMALAKAALLGAAANSHNTYVIGYGLEPFKDDGEGGFKAMIGMVPYSHQSLVCWDTYQKGFCPRRATCRWCHPTESDLAPIRVTLAARKKDKGKDTEKDAGSTESPSE